MTQETPDTPTVTVTTNTFCLSLPVDTRPYHNDPHRKVHEDGEGHHDETQEHRSVLSYAGNRNLGFGLIITTNTTTTATTVFSPL